MQYITTTELRIKTSKLIEELKSGGSVTLIHRSKIVGQFKPAQPDPKPFDPEAFEKAISGLNLPKTTYTHKMAYFGKTQIKANL